MPEPTLKSVTQIAYCKIFPAIGIARVGNSPDDYFIGPESPDLPPNPTGGFKDAAGRVKRQAARFRVYGFDGQDKVVQEMDASVSGLLLQWTVQLANKKASWYEFAGVKQGLKNDTKGDPNFLRNRSVTDRSKLEIRPAARTICGLGRTGVEYRFEDGRFFDIPVPLGELRTDEAGRLLVLGGFGASAKTANGKDITNYANNDFWYDDTSDGPVTLKVTVDGRDIVVRGGAWVLVAPPKFAPNHINLISLYDVMQEAAGVQFPTELSFQRDIYPLFSRVADYQWVNAMALRGHGPRRAGNFRDP